MSSCDSRQYTELLKEFTASEWRMKILLSLKNRESSAKELAQELHTRQTTVLHAIKYMDISKIVEKDHNQCYKLTNLGKLYAYELENTLKTMKVVDSHRNYWLNHQIDAIPPALLGRLDMLFGSEVITPDPIMPLKLYQELIFRIADSNVIRGVLPVAIFPNESAIFATPMKEGADIEVVVTDHLIQATQDGEVNPTIYKEQFKFQNVKIYQTSENVKLTFAVTNTFIYLNLCRNSGTYDISDGIIYIGDDAVEWGLQLFEYYKFRSELIAD